MSTLKGIAASAGIAIGRVYIYRPDDVILDLESHDSISAQEKLKAISMATESVHHQVQALYARMEEQGKSKEAEIFSAYQMFLDDPTLHEAMERYAREGYSTAAAVHRAYEDSAQLMDNLADAYFRERAKDIRDVGDRVVRALLGDAQGRPARPAVPGDRRCARPCSSGYRIRRPRECAGLCNRTG